MKRVKLANEPKLKAPNWIVKILGKGKEVSQVPCANHKEVKAAMVAAGAGSRIHIYKVSYEFKEAYQA